jgi:hypothetical protein
MDLLGPDPLILAGPGQLTQSPQSAPPTIRLNRHPPDDGLAEAKIGAFEGFWQCQVSLRGLPRFQAGDIGPVASKTRISLSSRRTSPVVFDRTHDNRTRQALGISAPSPLIAEKWKGPNSDYTRMILSRLVMKRRRAVPTPIGAIGR